MFLMIMVRMTVITVMLRASWLEEVESGFELVSARLVLFPFPPSLPYTLARGTEDYGLPRWLSDRESACQSRRHRRHRFDPWVGKISWRAWQPTPVFSPGQRSLVGYSTVHRIAKSQTWLKRSHTRTVTRLVCFKFFGIVKSRKTCL